jgi:hypothetical protein
VASFSFKHILLVISTSTCATPTLLKHPVSIVQNVAAAVTGELKTSILCCNNNCLRQRDITSVSFIMIHDVDVDKSMTTSWVTFTIQSSRGRSRSLLRCTVPRAFTGNSSHPLIGLTLCQHSQKLFSHVTFCRPTQFESQTRD